MKRILITVAFTILLTALCVKAAYITRGYFAIGGEWLLWAVPLLIEAAKVKEGAEDAS